MIFVDRKKCSGCALCVEACPQGAIRIQDSIAVIDQRLCRECEVCAEVCPAGAIRVVGPMYATSRKGGDTMRRRGWFGREGGWGRGKTPILSAAFTPGCAEDGGPRLTLVNMRRPFLMRYMATPTSATGEATTQPPEYPTTSRVDGSMASRNSKRREAKEMRYGYGYGYGFGFRGASPSWPYVGRGRGGFPRCWYPGAFIAPPYAPGPVPYSPPMTQEQEIDLLRSQAEAIKRELDQVEARIRDLEANK